MGVTRIVSLPVEIGVPPVATVYQLNVTPSWADEATKVIVCPKHMVVSAVGCVIVGLAVSTTLITTSLRGVATVHPLRIA